MAISYPIVFNTPKKNGNLVLTITQGELHEIGARMMAEFLEIEGWIVFYTGTNTPNESVIDLIKKVSARFLCISTTLPMNLVNTFQLISAVKSDSQLTNVKVLVGGQAYNTDPLLWQKIGADQYADSFESAVQFLDSCEDKDD
jgi:methanogenic corrinoid protein MtbC1